MKIKKAGAFLAVVALPCISLFFYKGLVQDHWDRLRSLPYVDYSAERANTDYQGVVHIDKEAVYNGYNLYHDRLKQTTFLLDMDGKVVKFWPDFTVFVISEDGSLIGTKDHKISKASWDGALIWQKDTRQHHDISISGDPSIYFLSTDVHDYQGRKVEFDVVVELSQDGKELCRWSSFDHRKELAKLHQPSKLDDPVSDVKPDIYHENRGSGGDYDYYHINSVQSLPETPLSSADKRFKRGNLLISLAYFNLIVILDKETSEIVWHWGPEELRYQHAPRMLDNGNILIFDNVGNKGYSRVVEVDPVSKKILWEYKGNPPEAFFTAGGGFAQRLDNGNTLVTESNRGHVFEINKEGRIVWDWFSKDFSEDLARRKVTARMYRYPKDFIDNFMRMSQ